MGLKRGNAVASQPAAQEASMNGVNLNEPDDDAGQAEERRVTPPPPTRNIQPAAPPPAAEAVTSPEVTAEERARAQTQVSAPASRTPAATNGNTAMAAASATVQQQLEEQGFEGLNFGFGSFPVISLQNEGHFESSAGGNLGQEFYCVMGASKQKWIFKNNAKGKAEDFAYSYDGEFSVAGEKISDITEAWAANGYSFEKKPYLDVQATLRTDDEDDGSLILLSIPKTAIPRFSGYIATLMAQGKAPSSVITRVYMGDKVTKVAHPFYPWAFKFYADL